jgi:tRNA(Arg) A34 adenosine deaminase TadA
LSPQTDALPAPRQRAFTSFANRDFRIFFFAASAAMMADNIEHVISYYVIFQKFHSPALGAFAVVSHWVPYLLLAGYTGGLADRFDIRRLIQISMLMFIGVSIGWGVMFRTDSTEEWKAMVLLVIHGLAGVIWAPASQVLIHRIVALDQLPSAVRLIATGRYLAFLLGPALGSAVLLAYFGPTYGIFINALIYVPMVVWLIKAPYGKETGHGARPQTLSGFSDIWATMRVVANNPILSSMTVMIGASAFFIGNAYQAQMPGFALDLGHGNPGAAYSRDHFRELGTTDAQYPDGLRAGDDLVRGAGELRTIEQLRLGNTHAVHRGLRGTRIQLDGAIFGADQCPRQHSRPGNRCVFDVGKRPAYLQRPERGLTGRKHWNPSFAHRERRRAVSSVCGLDDVAYFSRQIESSRGYGMTGLSDEHFMAQALECARRAARDGEVPVGAVLVAGDAVIAEGWNRPIASVDPTAHAEIVALRAGALRLSNYRLAACTLYATLEPCPMCMGALLNARVPRLVFGAWDQKAGACGSVVDLTREPRLTHRIDVFGGVCSEQSTALLKEFFQARR